jgi:hypothetical protein
MSYAELGETLGIGTESARQLAIRRKWARQKGNDRKARVAVPEEALRTHTESDTAKPTEASPDTDPSVDTVALRVANAALEVELRMVRQVLDDMRQALSDMRTDRDRWHAEATARRSWLWPWRRSA